MATRKLQGSEPSIGNADDAAPSLLDQSTTEPRKGTETPQRRHNRLMSWFETEMRRQSHNRYQMALDEDYYDSIQWLPEEAAEVKARGQNPVVYNETKPMIDWLIGIERRTRTDFTVFSLHDDSKEADEDAKCKTKLLKYLSEVNRIPSERSVAADDTFKAGLGWTEIGISPDPEEEPIFFRAESWRNMLYDSLATNRDLQDGRYQFRFRCVDLDVAVAFFPDKEDELRRAVVGRGDDHYMEWWNGRPIEEYDTPQSMPGKYAMFDSDAWTRNDRERVLLIECWHMDYARAKKSDPVRKQMFVTIMTEKDEILHAKSPYKHNRYPFVPHWCYRRKKDNAPYSPIRPVRGPQDGLNKRISKSLFVLSSNMVVAEAGAFDSKVMSAEEARDEAQNPDAFILLANGGMGKFKAERQNDIAEGHLKLAQVDQSIIRNASGVSDQTLNRTDVNQSGIALQRRSDQGSQLTAEIFDNLFFARQSEGEIMVSLIEQFYTEPKIFSIAGDRNKRDYVRINQPGPNGQRLNDITARKAQFSIGEQAWKQTLQEAAFEQMMELLNNLAAVAPGVVMALLDVTFELADLPNKQTILQRIRSVTGTTDPDEPMSPEQQQAVAQNKQQASLKAELELRQLMNMVTEAQQKGVNLNAQTIKTRMETLYVAMQAAQVVATVPHVTTAADNMLASTGFQDEHPAAAPAAPGPGGQAEVPQLDAPDANAPMPQPALADGAATGIETPAGDGIQTGAQ